MHTTDSGIRPAEARKIWWKLVKEAAADMELEPCHWERQSLTLNREPFVRRAQHRPLFRQIMSIHGLETGPDLAAVGTTVIPEYLVAVFQQDIVAVYHRSVGAASGGPLGLLRDIPLAPDAAARDRLQRRLARLAVRVIYALGLDFGLVRIALAPRGRLYVRGADPFPASPPGLAGKYAAAFAAYRAAAKAYAAQRSSANESAVALGHKPHFNHSHDSDFATRFDSNIINVHDSDVDTGHESAVAHRIDSDIVIGLDAEFVLTTPRGELVPADRYLPAGGPAGHDAAVIDRRVIHALAELRPAPSGEPRQLFANLRRAMRLAAARIDDPALEWRAGGSPVEGISLGGHIHFSGVPLTFELLRTLDNYLALPLALLEDARSLERRRTFGWLGNARVKNHGGFEYRTPASWLVSPVITRGVLVLAKLIAAHYRQLPGRPLDSVAMQRAFFAGDKKRLSRFLETWKRDMMGVAGSTPYTRELLPFIRLLESGYAWRETSDIRGAWKIKTPTAEARVNVSRTSATY